MILRGAKKPGAPFQPRVTKFRVPSDERVRLVVVLLVSCLPFLLPTNAHIWRQLQMYTSERYSSNLLYVCADFVVGIAVVDFTLGH